jgi:hypothetical protein
MARPIPIHSGTQHAGSHHLYFFWITAPGSTVTAAALDKFTESWALTWKS